MVLPRTARIADLEFPKYFRCGIDVGFQWQFTMIEC